MARPFDKLTAEKVMRELSFILNGTSPFLIQGSALGAYRDGGFTPEADDIDIGFLQEDFEVFGKNIALRLIGRGYEIRTINAPFTRCRSIKATKNGIKIDLNGFMLWKDQRFVCNSDPAVKPYAVVYPRQMIERLGSINVFGVDWNIPLHTKKYLVHEYGDWKTPSPSHVSACRVYDFVNKEKIPYDFLDQIEAEPVTGIAG